MSKKSPCAPPADSVDSASAMPHLAGIAPQLRTLAGGTALFRQGDKPFGIFRLLSGQIRMLRVTPAGAQVVLHTVRRNELFAEASLFSARYHCDAIATKASEVLLYPKAEVVRHLKTHPDELWQFAADLAHRVQGLRTQIEVRQIRSAPARVLQTLRLRCDDAGAWKLNGTLKQFAEDIGLTHEALYRALAKLERDEEITRSGDEIRLRNRNRATSPGSART